jgi:membrane dipeptidase
MAESPTPFIMDGHVHMINRQFYLGGDISDQYHDGQVDLPRMRKGGVNALFFSIYTSDDYYANRFEWKQTMMLMDLALRQLEKNQDQIELALNASDIERIYKSGKIAAFLHLEGAFDLDGDLGLLRNLYRLGVRTTMLVAHNSTNHFADSCGSNGKWAGITAHGIEVIQEMNRLGMVIDLAHASDATIQQAVAASRDPLLYSHGGSRYFVNIARNISDESVKAIAARGGVIGLQFGNSMNNPNYVEWLAKHKMAHPAAPSKHTTTFTKIEAVHAAVAKEYPPRPADIPEEVRMPADQMVCVLDHWIELVGEDHVSLGSDLDGWPALAKGMHDIGDFPVVIAAMRDRGYSDERIRKVAGLNLLRIIRQVTERQPIVQ